MTLNNCYKLIISIVYIFIQVCYNTVFFILKPILIADRGYRGEKDFEKTQLLTPSRPSPDDTEYKKREQRKRFRKRAGIEATIRHLKLELPQGRCYLKGEIGDQINVTLSSSAYNLRK